MSVHLRVVLDQAGAAENTAEAEAALSLTAGLIAAAPLGCQVDALVPAGATLDLPGVSAVTTLGKSRASLLAAWQRGFTAGARGGLVHAPTLIAPLRRHDRAHHNDQVVVTVWDLRPWEQPESLPSAIVATQRAFLRRAAAHADAIVVPSHALGQRLAAHAPVADRLRVIAGAAAEGIAAAPPRAADERPTVVVTGEGQSWDAGFAALAAMDVDVVALDVRADAEGELRARALAAGITPERLQLHGSLPAAERGGVLGGAAALLATSVAPVWPWRVVEAMTRGIPVIAADTEVHADVLAEAGILVPAEKFAEAVRAAVGADAGRLGVLSHDRARAFSWRSAAAQVWALHADL